VAGDEITELLTRKEIEACFGEKMKQEARRPGKRGPVNG